MFGFRNNKRRERYEENSSFPERIVIILTILVFAAVVLLCIFKFVFKEEAPEQITPEDYTQFSHENDFPFPYPVGVIPILYPLTTPRLHMLHIYPKMP